MMHWEGRSGRVAAPHFGTRKIPFDLHLFLYFYLVRDYDNILDDSHLPQHTGHEYLSDDSTSKRDGTIDILHTMDIQFTTE